MSTRMFTLQEARDALVIIRPLMSEIMRLQRKIMAEHRHTITLLPSGQLNVGGLDLSTLTADLLALDNCLSQIREHGGQIKDVQAGLVDFPGEINGRQVYLCWRHGEETISYYHDIGKGFDNRRPIVEAS